MNHAGALELAELLREHFLVDSGKPSMKLRESQHVMPRQVPEDRHLPSPADDAERYRGGTWGFRPIHFGNRWFPRGKYTPIMSVWHPEILHAYNRM